VGSTSLIGLDVALAGVARLGFDTSPFIYFIERHPNYVSLLREIFRRVDSGSITGCSSVVTVTEVLTRPKQLGDTALVQEYRSLLLQGRNFSVVPVDAAIAELAADLRASYRLRTPDALQIATAIQAGCKAFLTNDGALQRVDTLRVLLLDKLAP
jgi:predicted nucleic acid-binding protein